MKRDIHSLSDLATIMGTITDGHVPHYADGQWSSVLGDHLNVRAYGATGAGVDATSAIGEAVTAANKTASGGGGKYGTAFPQTVFLPPGVYGLTESITIPSFVSLKGAGQGRTAIIATNAAANLLFTGSYAKHGGFTFDGDNIATTGIRINVGAQNEYRDINVIDCVTDGMHVYNLQNSIMSNVNFYGNAVQGLYLDDGTGSCRFERMEFSGNKVNQLRLGKTASTSGYTDITENIFDSLVFESATAASQNSFLLVESCLNNILINCMFAPNTALAFPAVKLAKAAGASSNNLIIGANNYFQGSQATHTAFDIDANSILSWVSEQNYVSAFLRVYNLASTAKVRGTPPTPTSYTTLVNGAGGATEANTTFRNKFVQTLATRPGATDNVDLYRLQGEAVNRFQTNVSGKLEWGDGTNAVDATLYRNAADQLKTDDNLISALGVQSLAVARTATSDGLTTGTIAANTRVVTVTSADANNIIVLPTPTPGVQVTLAVGATGYELRSSAPATVAINGGTGAAAESAIGANVTTTCDCTSATTWICTDRSSAGVVSATQVAAP